jgi:RNA polymerase-binding transcription factor DksA
MSKTRPCQRCGQDIPGERIEALPETRLCLPCSQTVGGDFTRSFNQESLGKTGSLKKNYGGINVSKARKKIDRID